MKQIILKNGTTLLMRDSQNRNFEVSVVIKTGHINEPKLGLASLYENIVVRQACNSRKNLIPSYGGDITAFTTGGSVSSLERIVQGLWDSCCTPHLTSTVLYDAMDDIMKHTSDLSNVPERQTKMAYKHTAFAKNDVVWDPREYMISVANLNIDDVKSYICDNYVGKNLIISFSGPKDSFEQFRELCVRFFGSLPEGKRTPLKKLLYTGGFEKIKRDGTVLLAAFGWDISKLSDFAETNVLMSMLSSRLERELIPLGVGCDLKIAGYYGFRTLRILIDKKFAQFDDPDLLKSAQQQFKEAINIVCRNIKRVTHESANDRRMETSRQRAMTQRLAISNEKLLQTVEAAWLHLKRGISYDNNRCINKIWQLDAADVRDMAEKIFAQKLTLVTYGVDDISYGEVVGKMR